MLRKLTHVDARGEARMVDVGGKDVTRRTATATALLRISPELRRLIEDGAVPKGDVLGVSRVAGIMAAKKTADLIPLCHPLPIDACDVAVKLSRDGVSIRATVSTSAKTGVEMEALTAASVAALALYDMCKSVDRSMSIERVRLEEKRGGASGTYRRRGGARDG